MKTYRIEDMVGGWFVGNFLPTAFATTDVEVSYKEHPKGQIWDTHYHEYITEINFIISGSMILQNKKLISGDIFVLNPFEIADPDFIEDCKIICVKLPGKTNDKVIVKGKK